MGLAVHDDRLTRRVGTTVLLLLLGGIGLLIGTQRCSLRESFAATVYFEHVGPLSEDAEVQVAGRVIGKVESISLVPGRRAATPDHPPEGRDGVAVRLLVQERFAHMAPRNGTYFISAKGILGERYLEIGAPPENGPRDRALRAGDQLRGIDAPHLDRALWQSYLSMMLAQRFLGEIAPQVQTLMRIVDELTDTLEQMDMGARTRALATSFGALREQARAALVPWQSAEMTWSDVVSVSQRARLTLMRARTLVEVRAQAAVVGATIARIDRKIPTDLGDRLATTLATLERSIERAEKIMATLGELTAMIERGQGTVGALLFFMLCSILTFLSP